MLKTAIMKAVMAIDLSIKHLEFALKIAELKNAEMKLCGESYDESLDEIRKEIESIKYSRKNLIENELKNK